MQVFKNRLPYILCYITAFVTGLKQLREPDVWWQLISGRWMLEHKQITHTDVFSYTMKGQRWINVKWLYEILIASVEKIMGPLGVTFLQGAVNVAIVYLLFKCLALLGKNIGEPVHKFLSVLAILVFLAVVEYRMAGRPEMISHLLFTVFLFLALRSRSFEWKSLLWFIPLQCLWANMHEGYPVGLVLIAAFLAGSILTWFTRKDKIYLQQAMRLSVLFAIAVLVLLLNPNGIQLWKQPFEIYRQVWANKYTTELFSAANPEYWTIEAKMHIALLALVILFWVSKFIKVWKNKTLPQLYTPLTFGYLLLIFLFGYLSLTANRNIPFSQIVLYPTVPLMLGWLIRIVKLERLKIYQSLQKQSAWIACAAVLVFYFGIVSNVFYKMTGSFNSYGVRINALHNPTGVSTFIKQHYIAGPAFSDYFISSYLLWDLYPDFKSYIDLRDLDIFPTSFFDKYFDLNKESNLDTVMKKFQALDEKYNFNYIVVSTSQLVSLQYNLYWKEGYNLIYVDPVAALFLKQTKANGPLNSVQDFQKFSWTDVPKSPVWADVLTKIFNPLCSFPDEDERYKPLYEALFLKQMRNYPDAINALLPNISKVDDDAKVYTTLGNIYLEYAKVTPDRPLRMMRVDSAHNFIELAKEAK